MQIDKVIAKKNPTDIGHSIYDGRLNIILVYLSDKLLLLQPFHFQLKLKASCDINFQGVRFINEQKRMKTKFHIIFITQSDIIIRQKRMNKQQFDFNFENAGTQKNMQEVLDHVDKLSIDWDNFDAPRNDENSKQHSAVSDLFNKSKKSQSEMSQRKDFQDSRDIMEISIILPNTNNQNQKGSFRFEKEDQRNYPKNNQRYTRLQQLLQTAKKNSLEQFYKNIDRENKAYYDQPQKFGNYNQFKDYIKELKMEKRQKQSVAVQRQSANPFGSINSNKLYKDTNEKINTFNSNQLKSSNIESKNIYETKKQQYVQEKPKYNFVKKPVQDSNPFATDLLPTYYANQQYFEQQQIPSEPKQSPTEKFKNFYEPKPKQVVPEYNDESDAFGFFQSNRKKQAQKKEKEKKLQIIRQQKHNSFQKTMQQKKLEDLFQNYKDMRRNFEDLMHELKTTNQGQQNIVTELRKLKDEKYENQLRQNRKQRKEKKEKEQLEKNKKLDFIKDQIIKIKTSDKDILYSQINKKIEQLQSIVRSALEEINEEKEIKIIPKITNYFCDHTEHMPAKNQSVDIELNKSNKFQNGYDDEPIQERSIQNNQSSQQIYKDNIEQIQMQSRKKAHLFEQKKSRNKSNKQSEQRVRYSQQNLSKSISRKSNSKSNDIFSPLDVQLQANFDNSYDNEMFVEEFSPQDFAQEFYPRQFQVNSKNFRNSLIQKSSVVFQSFDFHVSARFTVVEDQIHPIIAALRIGNKCSIDLYDVHAIIYGPLGPGISTDPSTVFQEQVKKNSSFSFQVSVDKSCLQQNGFSIQLSYKTDSMSKKKINFKVPLPLVQLIRPQFIYEEKFMNDWESLTNELFIRPKKLDSNYLRSHEDLKLILPFIELNEEDPDSFAYGLMFRYPKSENIFYLKVRCYVSGKALIQLRLQKQGDKKLKEQILNVLSFILYGP